VLGLSAGADSGVDATGVFCTVGLAEQANDVAMRSATAP
jgi:hypothetical protein